MSKKVIIFLSAFFPTFLATTFLTNLYFHPVQIKKISVGEDNKAYIEKTLAKCSSNTPQGQSCWDSLIDKVMAEKGLDVTLDLIAQIYETEPNFSQTCHGLVHKVGQKAYELFEQNKDFKLSPKTSFCAYGFYHGFMENLTLRTKDLKRASQFCKYVDSQLSQESSDATLQCFHGIGHGLASYHTGAKGDEKAIINPALSLCEQVSSSDEELYRCASGVFNALALDYVDIEYKLPLNKEDPLRICRKQKEKFKESCFGNMNTLLASLTGNDLRKSARFIEDIAEDKYATSSIRYLLALLSPNNIDKQDQLVSDCRTIQQRLHLPCIQGIVHGLLEHGKPSFEYIEAFKFCRLGMLEKEEKDTCFKYALPYLSSIYPKEKVKDICLTMPDEYREFCRS